MSTLTMKDVRPYLDAYKTTYGVDSECSIDIIEAAITTLNTDDVSLIVQAMHDEDERAIEEAAEDAVSDTVTATETDDRLPVDDDVYSYADAMTDDVVKALDVNAKAMLEGKRGGAVIALDLLSLYGEETICNLWPVPGSKHPDGLRMTGNRKNDIYKAIVTKADGTQGPGEESWYRKYILRSRACEVESAALESLKAIGRGENGKHVLPEHEAIRGDKIRLKSKRAAIDGSIANKKTVLTRAVNLIQRMELANRSTELKCEILLEAVMNDRGQPVIHAASRKPVMVPVASNKLIQIWNAKDPRVGDVYTIGQFLALKIVEGGTYQSIVGTTKRAPKGSGKPVVNVKIDGPKQWEDTVAAEANYIDKVQSDFNAGDMKAYNAILTRLNAAGSDDFLMSLYKTAQFYESILSKPAIEKRLNTMLSDGLKKAV